MTTENSRIPPRSARRRSDSRSKNDVPLSKKELVNLVPGYKQKFKLSLAELKFVGFYIYYEGNATQAAMAACPSLSRNTASVRGSAMLRRAKIEEAINFWRVEWMRDIRIKCRDKALNMLKTQAFYDIGDLITKEGHFVISERRDLVDEDGIPRQGELTDIPKPLRQCIEGIERRHTGGYLYTKIKLVDPFKALDRLNEYLGMFAKEVTDQPTVSEDTARALSDVFNQVEDAVFKDVEDRPKTEVAKKAAIEDDGQGLLEW